MKMSLNIMNENMAVKQRLEAVFIRLRRHADQGQGLGVEGDHDGAVENFAVKISEGGSLIVETKFQRVPQEAQIILTQSCGLHSIRNIHIHVFLTSFSGNYTQNSNIMFCMFLCFSGCLLCCLQNRPFFGLCSVCLFMNIFD